MSSGVFRGKESSNRIELSWLVQDLLNFGVLGSLQLLGWGVGHMGVGGGWGVPPSHVHMHMHACTHRHAHIHIKHDNFNCKWQPPLGNSWEFPMMSYMCMSACMCMCGGHPLTIPHPSPPTHPPTPRGDPQNQSKFNSTWTNRDISILLEDLKSVETSTLMGGCIVWWVGGWLGGLRVGSGQNTKI